MTLPNSPLPTTIVVGSSGHIAQTNLAWAAVNQHKIDIESLQSAVTALQAGGGGSGSGTPSRVVVTATSGGAFTTTASLQWDDTAKSLSVGGAAGAGSPKDAVFVVPAGDTAGGNQNGVVVKVPDVNWGAGPNEADAAQSYGYGQAFMLVDYQGSRADRSAAGSVLFRIDRWGGLGTVGGLHVATGLRGGQSPAPLQAVWLDPSINCVPLVIHNASIAEVANWTLPLFSIVDVRRSPAYEVVEVQPDGTFWVRQRLLVTHYNLDENPIWCATAGAAFGTSQIHMGRGAELGGGFIGGGNAGGAGYMLSSCNASLNSSGQWVSYASIASVAGFDGLGRWAMYYDTGLTSGNVYSPTLRIILGSDGSVSLTGFIDVQEQAVQPTSPAANHARLFAIDNGSGITQLKVVWPGGTAHTLIDSTGAGGAGGGAQTNYAPTGLPGANAVGSRYVGATSGGAPASGTFVAGDFIVDRAGTIWVCTIGGTPGTWVDVSADALAGRELAYAEFSGPGNLTFTGAGQQVLHASLTITFTVGSRPVYVETIVPVMTHSAANGFVNMLHTDASGVGETARSTTTFSTANAAQSIRVFERITAAGTYTRKVYLQTASTLTVYGPAAGTAAPQGRPSIRAWQA